MHLLSTEWVLWAHLPHDTSWSIDSYIKIMTVSHVEEVSALLHALPDKLVTNCMFFMMKNGIAPTWEDDHNRHGGCFSYKITHKIASTWQNTVFSVIGKTITADQDFLDAITGISISPKKNFCILKLWMSSCRFTDPHKVNSLRASGCIFKKH